MEELKSCEKSFEKKIKSAERFKKYMGKEYHENGTPSYIGEMVKGKREGQGTQYYPNGNIQYVGGFFAGEWHGLGKLFDEDGHLIVEELFIMGRMFT